MDQRLSAEQRRTAIVKAALPLFARKGFANTTTRELAEAAGVSEALIYKHFPSKESLYAEIQNTGCKDKDNGLEKLAGKTACGLRITSRPSSRSITCPRSR